MTFASPQSSALEDCYFYHSLDLPGVGKVVGDWDLRGREDAYLGGADFRDKRVLDVGTAGGALAFAAEARGAAEVVGFDADGWERIDFLPLIDWMTPSPELREQRADKLRRQKNGFWFAHAALGSRVKAFYGDVQNLPEALGAFDMVIVGQILVHLRDPIGALIQAAQRCSGTLIIAEGMLTDRPEPFAKLLQHAPTHPAAQWWHLSPALYAEVLAWLGFKIASQTTGLYRSVGEGRDIAITTIVAERRTAPP